MKKYRFKVGDYFRFKNKYWDIFGVIEKIDYDSNSKIRFKFRYIQCNKILGTFNNRGNMDRFQFNSPMYNDSEIFKTPEKAMIELL